MASRRSSGILIVLSLLLACAVVLKTCQTFVPAAPKAKDASITQLGRRSALLLPGLLVQPRPAHAEGKCDAKDLKMWEDGIKDKMDTVMSDCVLKDPPGGTWEDRCIRAFG